MGSAIAGNLLRAGHELTAYNRTRAKAEALTAAGARVAGSPAEACSGVEAVLTMLSDDAAVREVVTGKQGVAGGLPPEAIHISLSTISTGLARELTAEHSARGQGYLSVPVFGRPEAAEAAKLIVVPAGPAARIDRCRPLFDAIGRQTTVVGSEPWQANAVKLCGNFMIASMMESFGEAYATLRKSGVDPHLFLDVMNGLFASPVYANYGRMIADGKFTPAGFALSLGLKDIRLGLEAAQECASPMPFASVLRDHLLSALANGQGDMDWSSLAQVAARNAGL
jgi:3-hydroxyisobutyrate dehydrogenase-like beta-hydroxyacid dehydrogenase